MLPRYSGAVLIGGSSRRMGADKAFVDFEGQPLVERPLDALAGAEHRLAVGGDQARVRSYDVEWIEDPEPSWGPLGGVISALRSSQTRITVVLSCDLPFIDREAVEHLVTGIGTADGCVPLLEGRKQWTIAAWSISALPMLERAHALGERSLRRCATNLSLVWLLDDRPRRFIDVDTPHELRSALVSGPAGRAR